MVFWLLGVVMVLMLLCGLEPFARYSNACGTTTFRSQHIYIYMHASCICTSFQHITRLYMYMNIVVFVWKCECSLLKRRGEGSVKSLHVLGTLTRARVLFLPVKRDAGVRFMNQAMCHPQANVMCQYKRILFCTVFSLHLFRVLSLSRSFAMFVSCLCPCIYHHMMWMCISIDLCMSEFIHGMLNDTRFAAVNAVMLFLCLHTFDTYTNRYVFTPAQCIHSYYYHSIDASICSGFSACTTLYEAAA